MAVTIVSTDQKIDMVIEHNEGATLTELGADFEVSRKTVRRCIDEVMSFFNSLSLGSTVKLMTDEGITIDVVVRKKDDKIEDDLPVAVEFPEGVIDYVLLERLIHGATAEEDQVEAVAEVEGFVDCTTVPPQGARVRIKEDSEFFGQGHNPFKVVEGTVTSSTDPDNLFNEEGYFFWVKWDNEISNCYRMRDVQVAVAEVEEVSTVLESGDDTEAAEDVADYDDAQYFVTAPQDSITIVRIDQETGEISRRQTNKHRVDFAELRESIKGDQSQENLRDIYIQLDTKRMLESYSVGRIKVDPEQETVVLVKPDGSQRTVPDDIATDIITTVSEYGKDRGDRLVRFLDKLMDNVSFKAIEGLYRFMKHNCIEINEDGSIQAWKGVRSDLYSQSAGKIQDSPTCPVKDGRIYNGNFGTEIRVDRSEVDDDPDQTCSHGLHVGNRGYATGFSTKLLRVKVEPQDVVAVPKDYNGAKMRCCAYTPLEAM